VRAVVREPLVHFLMIGAALFAIGYVRGEPIAPRPAAVPASARAPIVIDDALRARLRDGWARVHDAPPSDDELAGMVQRWVDDEVLYREGLARGLDRDDPAVRQRVAQQMAFVLERQVVMRDPSDAELRAWFEARRDRWAEPERVDFTHVFVAGQDRAAEARAHDLLAQLTAGADPTGLGDRFSGGRHYRGRKIEDLVRAFGPEFGEGLGAQPTGTWTLRRSRHGLHLVRVERHTAAHAADLATLRADVAKAWRDEHSEQALADAVRALRAAWPVVER